MVDYPDDGYTEIHLRSDQALIRVRKLLAELEAKTAPGAAEKAAA
jgi:hypothetical protein